MQDVQIGGATHVAFRLRRVSQSRDLDLDTRRIYGREVEKIGTVRHDFTHKRLNVTVYTSAATPLDILTHPDTVPLSTLDKKILVLFKADKSEQS